MQQTQLRFENVQKVMDNEDFSVILLTDMERKRAISVICDETMTHQLVLRTNAPEQCKTLLPEALVSMLTGQYEMVIYGIYDGQYQVVLQEKEFRHSTRIRISDAVLLHLIAGFPIFMEESLMKRQCIPFDEQAKGVAIPINTMDTKGLNFALEKAIREENYELASQLRDEIRRRGEGRVES